MTANSMVTPDVRAPSGRGCLGIPAPRPPFLRRCSLLLNHKIHEPDDGGSDQLRRSMAHGTVIAGNRKAAMVIGDGHKGAHGARQE
jgi:hypothetical protein